MIFIRTSHKFGQWLDAQADIVYGLGFASDIELNKVCNYARLIICFDIENMGHEVLE